MSEMVERVDRDDRVIGLIPRAEAIRNRWLHRIALVVCTDEHGRVLLLRTSASDPRWPGEPTFMSGGAVNPGESYQAAGERELAEELGVAARARFLFKQVCTNTDNPILVGLCHARLDRAPVPDQREIAACEWIEHSMATSMLSSGGVRPHVADLMRRYLDAPGR